MANFEDENPRGSSYPMELRALGRPSARTPFVPRFSAEETFAKDALREAFDEPVTLA
jgi:hypothetical protein